MLGGRRSFAEGGYAGTPLADALPLVLDPAHAGDTTFFAELKVEPTRAGRNHPVTQIAGDLPKSAERWATLPPLSAFNHAEHLKPGATALLVGSGPGVAGRTGGACASTLRSWNLARLSGAGLVDVADARRHPT